MERTASAVHDGRAGGDLEGVDEKLALLGDAYEECKPRIRQYLVRRMDSDDAADDLVGLVFTKAVAAIREGRGWKDSLSGWLFRIAHNALIDFYRWRDRYSESTIDDIAETHMADGDIAEEVALMLSAEEAKRAMRRLTIEQSEVLRMRYLEGLGIAEVAEVLAKTEGAIKALQYRAVQTLRSLLANHSEREPLPPVLTWDGHVVHRVKIVPGEKMCVRCGEILMPMIQKGGVTNEVVCPLCGAREGVPTVSYLRDGEWERVG